MVILKLKTGAFIYNQRIKPLHFKNPVKVDFESSTGRTHVKIYQGDKVVLSSSWDWEEDSFRSID